jgi:hypothetical protein
MTIHGFPVHSLGDSSSALDQYPPVAQNRLVKIDQIPRTGQKPGYSFAWLQRFQSLARVRQDRKTPLWPHTKSIPVR